MNPMALAVTAVGIALLVMGIHSADSVSSSFSRLFTGHPTDKAIWLLVGGIAATVSGLAMLFRRNAV